MRRQRGRIIGRMNESLRLCPADPAAGTTADEIHAVWMQAYAQEAALLGAKDFPPLRVTVEDLRACRESFFVARIGQELVACTSVAPAEDRADITAMVVAPAYQRRGIASRLLAEILRVYGSSTVTVQTAAKNAPALALYTQAGFVPVRYWAVGPEQLQLVKLCRSPGAEVRQHPENAA